jgi:ABC-type transport system involved in multi-copper enzyme maturation permease subunit
MSPAREATLTAAREIRRNLRSTKGIAMFVLFFLGGAVPRIFELLFVKLIDKNTGEAIPAEMQRKVQHELYEQLLQRVYEPDVAKHLAACPSALFALFEGTIIFVPLLILLIGFDQIAGDVQHRSIRYLAGRARRASIVAGKALGSWAVISLMVLVLHTTVWILMLALGGNEPSAVLAWGPRFWLFSAAYAAAYVGLTALVSSFFRTPIVALFVGVAVFFVLWLVRTILGFIPAVESATWAFPATYEKLLISPEPLRMLGGMAAAIGWGAVMVMAASAIVQRRDL